MRPQVWQRTPDNPRAAVKRPSMLRIAVDARPLNQQFNGIGQYLFQILDHLLTEENSAGHQWLLYSNRPLDIPSRWQRVSNRSSGEDSNRLLGAIRAQLLFGRWAVEDEATIYWSPRHQLPIGLPRTLPTVVTLHDLVFRLYPETMSKAGRWYDAWLTPKALKRAHSIITTSESVNAELKSLFPNCASKSCSIKLSSALAPITTEHQVRPRPYAIFCGTMEPRKNLDRLIRALASVNERRQDAIELVIVSGGGWRNQSTLELIKRHGSFIDYHPSASTEDKAILIQNATCLVLPSLYEGFGLPIVEAQKLGVPVLTSNRGAMPEVAGAGALFVDPTDESAIGQGLTRFFDDPALRNRLAKAAGELGQQHSWGRTAQLTLDVLNTAGITRTGVPAQSQGQSDRHPD